MSTKACANSAVRRTPYRSDRTIDAPYGLRPCQYQRRSRWCTVSLKYAAMPVRSRSDRASTSRSGTWKSSLEALPVLPKAGSAPYRWDSTIDAPYACGVPVHDKSSRVEEQEQEFATSNLGTIVLSLACVFPPRSGTGTIAVFDGTVH